MDSTALIWIILAIAAALVVVIVIAFFVARRNSGRRDAVRHEKAEDLRARARQSAVAAEEVEARRARVEADAATAAAEAERAKARAAQAEVDARRYADEHADEVEKHRQEEAEIRRKADELDPYVDGDAARSSAAGTPAGRITKDRYGEPPTTTDRTTARADDAVDDSQSAPSSVRETPAGVDEDPVAHPTGDTAGTPGPRRRGDAV
ncbi:hypothetical protein ABZ477_12995 [Microbacterium sp. NPDC019599]|uniref:hypothetical protein n=1 Tax=Microbacterium sp. NPDC019599 TaxID=3154690 RepID=UPI0033D02933